MTSTKPQAKNCLKQSQSLLKRKKNKTPIGILFFFCLGLVDNPFKVEAVCFLVGSERACYFSAVKHFTGRDIECGQLRTPVRLQISLCQYRLVISNKNLPIAIGPAFPFRGALKRDAVQHLILHKIKGLERPIAVRLMQLIEDAILDRIRQGIMGEISDVAKVRPLLRILGVSLERFGDNLLYIFDRCQIVLFEADHQEDTFFIILRQDSCRNALVAGETFRHLEDKVLFQ